MENPTSPPATPKSSTFKTILLVLLGIVMLSFVLQFAGVKVMNVKESDEVIERPHG